ncbi:YcaO-like family protein [Streptomyces sp. cg35]|uniref:YcaO-like family protein n=1 Tax=Streptomyces sp. cg35 TaxID=3421650 RepID=UPI003D1677D3
MIDFNASLDPVNGLVDTSVLLPPSPPVDLLWRSMVSLVGAAEGHPGGTATGGGRALDPQVVGAYGHSRRDAVTRGVGEGVERYALFPHRAAPAGAVRRRRSELDGSALEFERADVALGSPEAVDERMNWYPARRVVDDTRVWVPAPLVDYPVAVPQQGAELRHLFDPSPSGAASGQGTGHALRSALLEIVERDALLVAWQRQSALRLVDLDASLTGRDNANWRRLARLREAARRAGLTLLAADLPTAIPGVVCTVGIVLDTTASVPLATVGCNATDDVAWSILGALQEALQIRSVIVNAWQAGWGDAPTPAPTTILDDADRLRYVASRENFHAVRRWLSHFRPPLAPSVEHRVRTDDIVRAMAADGADPLVVELTHRLPTPLQDMGWAAVKAIVPGYQPLRMIERLDFTWNRSRLATATQRTGLPAVPCDPHQGEDAGPGPHPLP